MEQFISNDLPTWLIESYSRLHGKLDPWENQELYSAFSNGSDAFYLALKKIFGVKLHMAILDVSERAIEICKNYDMPLSSSSTENEIWINNLLIADVNQIAEDLMKFVQTHLPDIQDQCRINAELCNVYTKKAEKAMSKLMKKFNKVRLPKE